MVSTRGVAAMDLRGCSVVEYLVHSGKVSLFSGFGSFQISENRIVPTLRPLLGGTLDVEVVF